MALRAAPEFKERLAKRYNDTFNCFVRPKYNGAHQDFPGLHREALGIKDLYPSQKDAIWMIKLGGGAICDHEVGAGKTLIMCFAKILYPGKEDFTPEKRKGIFASIKNNDWDCIILTHDQFCKIPQSPRGATQHLARGIGRCRRESSSDRRAGWQSIPEYAQRNAQAQRELRSSP